MSKSLTAIMLACMIGSCSPINADQNYIEHKETRVKRFMGMAPPPDCSQFYDNNMHSQWADCMGVSYK